MKFLALFLSTLITTTTFASTYVQFPLLIRTPRFFTVDTLTAEKFNREFYKSGYYDMNPLNKELISVENNIQSLEKAKTIYYGADLSLDTYRYAYDKNFNIEAAYPGEFQDKKGVCFSGDPAETVRILDKLRGTFFNEKLIIRAWKHKGSKKLYPGRSYRSDITPEYINAKFPQWKNWSDKKDSMAVIYESRDVDYPEVYFGIIKKCSQKN